MLCVADMLCAEPEETSVAVDPSCGFPEQEEINGSSMAIRTICAVQCICLLLMFSSSLRQYEINLQKDGRRGPGEKRGPRLYVIP